MIVLILERVPVSLRGELTRWLLEPRAGVFIGTVAANVRDLLWEKACQRSDGGGCILIHPAANEQGYTMRTWGDTSRWAEDFEGLTLIRRPVQAPAQGEAQNGHAEQG